MTALRNLCVLVILALAGCSTTPYTGGTLVTEEAEVKRLISGYSFNDANQGLYFSPGGQALGVQTSSQSISIGKWSIRSPVGVPVLCSTDDKAYKQFDGQTVSVDMVQACSSLYLQDDGSIILNIMGGGSQRLPQATKGWPKQTEFNALRRKLGV